MGRCRVVTPEVVRLTISDGDYLDVKKTLNAGEYRDLISGMAAPTTLGERAVLDIARIGMSKILQYLVGWSLVGVGDKPLPYSLDLPEEVRRSTLRSLDQGTFAEIASAVDTHEAQDDARMAALKNAPAGASAPSAISTSVD